MKITLLLLAAMTTTTVHADQFAIDCDDGLKGAYVTDLGYSQITLGTAHFNHGLPSEVENDPKAGYLVFQFATNEHGDLATLSIPPEGDRIGISVVRQSDEKVLYQSSCKLTIIRLQ